MFNNKKIVHITNDPATVGIWKQVSVPLCPRNTRAKWSGQPLDYATCRAGCEDLKGIIPRRLSQTWTGIRESTIFTPGLDTISRPRQLARQMSVVAHCGVKDCLCSEAQGRQWRPPLPRNPGVHGNVFSGVSASFGHPHQPDKPRQTHTYGNKHIYTHRQTHTHTRTETNTYTHRHTHTHTHTHTCYIPSSQTYRQTIIAGLHIATLQSHIC